MKTVAISLQPTDLLRVCRALREAALTRTWQDNPIGELSYSALAEVLEKRLLAFHDGEADQRLAAAVLDATPVPG